MRLVRAIQKKKQSWSLSYQAQPSGTIHVDVHGRRGAGWTPCANLVVAAALRPVSVERGRLRLCERTTGQIFETVGASTFDLVAGLLTHRLRIDDGYATGHWTFVNRSGDIFIEPCDAAAGAAEGPAEAPADAPDLSDFIKTLGREG